ncbi:hypothetical protein ACIQ1J_35290 [Streptomyces sp. NPDC097107]|uniref:hypothetical protein n=1 Tax=Streptomyces sp. NPDC097107 TaxID=3366089 RepID=UPI0037F4BAE1
MAEASRHWDGAGLERKIRAAGRPWTVGDIAMVADGQWGVGVHPDQWPDEETVERRVAEGRRVELTMEELARAVAPPGRRGPPRRESELSVQRRSPAVGADGLTTAAGEDGSGTAPGACGVCPERATAACQPNRRCLNLGCGGLPSLHHAPDRLEVRTALRVGDAEADRRFGDPVEFVEVRHIPMPGQGVKMVLVNGYCVVP